MFSLLICFCWLDVSVVSIFDFLPLVEDFCFCFPLLVCVFGVVFICFLLVCLSLVSVCSFEVDGSFVSLWDLVLGFIGFNGVGGFVMSLTIWIILFCCASFGGDGNVD